MSLLPAPGTLWKLYGWAWTAMVIGPQLADAPAPPPPADPSPAVPVADADSVRLTVKEPPDAFTYFGPDVVETPVGAGSPNSSFALPGCDGPPLLKLPALAEEVSPR